MAKEQLDSIEIKIELCRMLKELDEYLGGHGIQYSIMSWTNPPNAPATIAIKGYDAPLRHSLLLHDSIKYEVVEGKL